MGDVRPYEQDPAAPERCTDAKDFSSCLHYAQCQIDEGKKMVIFLPDEVRLRWNKENGNQNL